MGQNWTNFQLLCVQEIAGYLKSIRGLVEALGPDALGCYCRNGRLGSECLDRIKQAEFTKPDDDEGEPEDEEEGEYEEEEEDEE